MGNFSQYGENSPLEMVRRTKTGVIWRPPDGTRAALGVSAALTARHSSGPRLYYRDEDPRDRDPRGALWARCSWNPVDAQGRIYWNDLSYPRLPPPGAIQGAAPLVQPIAPSPIMVPPQLPLEPDTAGQPAPPPKAP